MKWKVFHSTRCDYVSAVSNIVNKGYAAYIFLPLAA
jgi:hypothetical protein